MRVNWWNVWKSAHHDTSRRPLTIPLAKNARGCINRKSVRGARTEARVRKLREKGGAPEGVPYKRWGRDGSARIFCW